MAAITAAIDQYEEEQALAAPAAMPGPAATSYWKHWGVGEMMRMRVLWQLRMCSPRPF